MAGIGRELNLQFVLGYDPTGICGRPRGASPRALTRYPEIVTGTVDVAGCRRLQRPRQPRGAREDPRRAVGQGGPSSWPTPSRQYAAHSTADARRAPASVVSGDGTRSCSRGRRRRRSGERAVGVRRRQRRSGDPCRVAADLPPTPTPSLPAQERARRERTCEQAAASSRTRRTPTHRWLRSRSPAGCSP